jgi:16S rRNA (guanine966-N2)-methyltransferase
MLEPVRGARVLDLYAGSGALGIEALSRGAGHAVLVDSDARAVAAIRRNMTELGIIATSSPPEAEGLYAEVVRRDVLAYLAGRPGPFDLILVDPPYSCALQSAEALAERLAPVCSENARIVTESDKRAPLELPLPLLRERTYGDTRVAIHRGA